MTKEKIILAALRLFLLCGYKSVSLMDVAHEAGITKGGIYHYFSSKDELLHITLQFLFDRFEAKYADLLNGNKPLKAILYSLIVDHTPENYIKEFLGAESECKLDYADFAITAMRKFPDMQQRIEHSYLTICSDLAKQIDTAMGNGEIKGGFDSFALAANILALSNGQNSLGSPFRSPAVRQRMLESLLLMVTP